MKGASDTQKPTTHPKHYYLLTLDNASQLVGQLVDPQHDKIVHDVVGKRVLCYRLTYQGGILVDIPARFLSWISNKRMTHAPSPADLSTLFPRAATLDSHRAQDIVGEFYDHNRYYAHQRAKRGDYWSSPGSGHYPIRAVKGMGSHSGEGDEVLPSPAQENAYTIDGADKAPWAPVTRGNMGMLAELEREKKVQRYGANEAAVHAPQPVSAGSDGQSHAYDGELNDWIAGVEVGVQPESVMSPSPSPNRRDGLTLRVGVDGGTGLQILASPTFSPLLPQQQHHLLSPPLTRNSSDVVTSTHLPRTPNLQDLLASLIPLCLLRSSTTMMSLTGPAEVQRASLSQQASTTFPSLTAPRHQHQHRHQSHYTHNHHHPLHSHPYQRPSPIRSSLSTVAWPHESPDADGDEHAGDGSESELPSLMHPHEDFVLSRSAMAQYQSQGLMVAERRSHAEADAGGTNDPLGSAGEDRSWALGAVGAGIRMGARNDADGCNLAEGASNQDEVDEAADWEDEENMGEDLEYANTDVSAVAGELVRDEENILVDDDDDYNDSRDGGEGGVLVSAPPRRSMRAVSGSSPTAGAGVSASTEGAAVLTGPMRTKSRRRQQVLHTHERPQELGLLGPSGKVTQWAMTSSTLGARRAQAREARARGLEDWESGMMNALLGIGSHGDRPPLPT
ncbi:hypothetical protein DL93DRAFT_1790415 [Clavulina sp. PMI_390]|nr:hypothetical protein DL93DRAFT_1790415 [Clavulina sp. PMI_390]